MKKYKHKEELVAIVGPRNVTRGNTGVSSLLGTWLRNQRKWVTRWNDHPAGPEGRNEISREAAYEKYGARGSSRDFLAPASVEPWSGEENRHVHHRPIKGSRGENFMKKILGLLNSPGYNTKYYRNWVYESFNTDKEGFEMLTYNHLGERLTIVVTTQWGMSGISRPMIRVGSSRSSSIAPIR